MTTISLWWRLTNRVGTLEPKIESLESESAEVRITLASSIPSAPPSDQKKIINAYIDQESNLVIISEE